MTCSRWRTPSCMGWLMLANTWAGTLEGAGYVLGPTGFGRWTRACRRCQRTKERSMEDSSGRQTRQARQHKQPSSTSTSSRTRRRLQAVQPQERQLLMPPAVAVVAAAQARASSRAALAGCLGYLVVAGRTKQPRAQPQPWLVRKGLMCSKLSSAISIRVMGSSFSNKCCSLSARSCQS